MSQAFTSPQSVRHHVPYPLTLAALEIVELLGRRPVELQPLAEVLAKFRTFDFREVSIYLARFQAPPTPLKVVEHPDFGPGAVGGTSGLPEWQGRLFSSHHHLAGGIAAWLLEGELERLPSYSVEACQDDLDELRHWLPAEIHREAGALCDFWAGGPPIVDGSLLPHPPATEEPPPTTDEASVKLGTTTPPASDAHSSQLIDPIPTQERKFTIANMRDLTGLGNTTLNKYAKKAGVPTPPKGKRDFKYRDEDARQILLTIVAETSESKVREHCRRSLQLNCQITE